MNLPKHWTARPSHFWEVVDICAKYIYTMPCTTKHQFFVYIENMPLFHVYKGRTVADNPFLYRRGRAFGWFLGCQSLAQMPAASHSPIPMSKNLKVLPRKVKEFDQQVVPGRAVDLLGPIEPQNQNHILFLFYWVDWVVARDP